MTGTDHNSGGSFAPRSPTGSTAVPGAAATENSTAGRQAAREPFATEPSATRSPQSLPALNVRYGRIILALAGILGLLGAVTTFPFAAFGVVPAAWPVLLGVIAVSAIALLRALAVRDRRARVNRAFAEAMWPEPAGNTGFETVVAGPPRELPRTGRMPETVLFDMEQPTPPAPTETEPADPAGPGTGGKSSGEPHHEEPLREPGEDPEHRSGTPGAARGSTWQPIDVPRPTYVDAARAERSAPAPLELPDAPKPAGRTSFKESAAALATARPSSAADEPANSSPVGKINLDDILQRRRA
ncbi:hypothetical protein [Arthrobacter sp. H41]|uniref:hypothetical protein n=1 Tax=Arthrobacter sp. H41 TaxID=1312978 RepID=UPI0012DD7F11|nr:hypothetical protein [Arthrobacter sp. H41]